MTDDTIPARRPTPVRDFLLKYRRYLAWLYALLLLALMAPSVRSILLWLPLIALGAGLRIWASGCIEKNVNIAWSGPYRHVRNPLYIGSFLIGLGVTLTADSWILLALYLLLFLVVYRHGVIAEERLLEQKFGRDFKRYCAHVPRFLPRPVATREGSVGFRMYLVMRHREYNTWLAIIAIYIIFCLALDHWKGFYEAGRILGS